MRHARRARISTATPPLAWAVVGAALGAVGGLAGGASAPSAVVGAAQSVELPPVDWTLRLEALTPAVPEGYLALAEEVADAARDDDDRALARQLFALAGTLDAPRLGRSACLALADLEAGESARRRYLALASLLDEKLEFSGTLDRAGGESPSTGTIDSTTALAVAEALGHYRRGNGARALGALREEGAEDLLRRHESFLRGGLDRFLEDCRLYRGQVRPSLSGDAVTRLVQLEVALLAGPERSWADELMIAGRAPLVEVDPTRLAEALQVNPQLCIYRSARGGWVAP